jgi:hypothetical protein
MEEPKTFNKKIRIQLYDKDFNQLSDKLVAQDLELTKGPKEAHTGPMKIEVCLFEQVDITDFISYLARIQNKLPLITKVKKAKALISKDDEGWREQLIAKMEEMVKDDTISCQEALIAELRKEGFVFLTWDTLPQKPKFEKMAAHFDEVESLLESYQWMIPLIKEAKNPINNKYDPYLMYGFKLLGKKNKKVLLMANLETVNEIALPWAAKDDNHFRKTEMAKFPDYMVLEEREKFRIELYKYRKDPEGWEFSKFFKRWAKDVDFKEKEELLDKGLL